MVANGRSGATNLTALNTIEVIDLSSNPTACTNLPNFPTKVRALGVDVLKFVIGE